MGDPVAIYLQLLNSAAQLLWWATPNRPVVCDCQCPETEQGISATCAALVKELFAYCLETGTSSSITTTTTNRPLRHTWDFSWLWVLLLVVVFVSGVVAGNFWNKKFRKEPECLAIAQAAQPNEPSPLRVRRGVAA